MLVRSAIKRSVIVQARPEAKALKWRMPAGPGARRFRLISRTISAGIGIGFWPVADIVYFQAAHEAVASTLEWKGKDNAAYNLSAVGTVTFTQNKGRNGNGTSSYDNTNWTASTNGINYTLASAGFGGYLNAGPTTLSATITSMGALTAAGAGMLVRPNNASNLAMRLNNTTTLASGGAVSTRLGFTTADRLIGNLEMYRNAALLSNQAAPAVAVPNVPLYLGALNNNGVAANFCSNTFGFAHASATLGATLQARLYNEMVLPYLNALTAA